MGSSSNQWAISAVAERRIGVDVDVLDDRTAADPLDRQSDHGHINIVAQTKSNSLPRASGVPRCGLYPMRYPRRSRWMGLDSRPGDVRSYHCHIEFDPVSGSARSAEER